MLADSSVWIPFLRGDSSVEVEILANALSQPQSVWIAPPILQEVLQGADRPERFARWDRVLGELPLLVNLDARAAARRRMMIACQMSSELHQSGRSIPAPPRLRRSPSTAVMPVKTGAFRL